MANSTTTTPSTHNTLRQYGILFGFIGLGSVIAIALTLLVYMPLYKLFHSSLGGIQDFWIALGAFFITIIVSFITWLGIIIYFISRAVKYIDHHNLHTEPSQSGLTLRIVFVLIIVIGSSIFAMNHLMGIILR